jgi:hypothetical protein
MGVQKHYNKRFTKKIVSKSFYKKIDKKSKTDFFLFLDARCFFITFLGDSRRGEFKNTIKKLTKKLISPGTFLAPEEPTNHPKVRQK